MWCELLFAFARSIADSKRETCLCVSKCSVSPAPCFSNPFSASWSHSCHSIPNVPASQCNIPTTAFLNKESLQNPQMSSQSRGAPRRWGFEMHSQSPLSNSLLSTQMILIIPILSLSLVVFLCFRLCAKAEAQGQCCDFLPSSITEDTGYSLSLSRSLVRSFGLPLPWYFQPYPHSLHFPPLLPFPHSYMDSKGKE